MNQGTESTYIHGTSTAEQARLALLNRILNQRCLDALGIRPGEQILEMGAGTGIFAGEMARVAGCHGRVVAVERDPDQLRAGRERSRDDAAPFDLRCGDAYSPPLTADEWGRFDLVHARFLLEHLARPLAAVQVMVRAARPGGRIALIDDDHSLMRFWPDPGGMAQLWQDYAIQYAHSGNDADIGTKLVALLYDAGARPVQTAMIHFGACAGEPNFAPAAANLAEILSGARAAVLRGSTWTEAAFDDALARFRAWSQRPDAAIWYGLPCVVAIRPQGANS